MFSRAYKGVVVFHEGNHYGVNKQGHIDLKKRLSLDPATGEYRKAGKDAPSHNDQHGQNVIDLELGG